MTKNRFAAFSDKERKVLWQGLSEIFWQTAPSHNLKRKTIEVMQDELLLLDNEVRYDQ